jgi:hypothetical protein
MFCHNLYLANGNTGVVVRGNIIANASSHGMQLRSGGTATNNLFVQNAIALSVGGGTEPEPSGVTALVLGNVILDGKDIDAANPRGWGVWFGNIAQGEASGNVVAHNVLGRHAYGLTLAGDEQGAHGIHDLRISGNVFYDWGGGILVEGDASQLSGIVVEGNDLQEPRLDLLLDVNDPAGIAGLSWSNNRCQGRPVPGDAWMRIGWDRRSRAQWPPPFNNFTTAASAAAFPEPQRDVPSYCHSLGRDAALATFLEQARAQSKSRWLPEFTAAAVNHYVREGFGMTDR